MFQIYPRGLGQGAVNPGGVLDPSLTTKPLPPAPTHFPWGWLAAGVAVLGAGYYFVKRR